MSEKSWENSDSISPAVPSIVPHDASTLPRQRSVFSAGASRLGRHRIGQRSQSTDRDVREVRRRHTSSSQLLDDLIARPVDPMFEDATLTQHTVSKTHRIVTQILAFILCVAMGIVSMQAVRNLQGRSREAVRTTLANQVSSANAESQKLQNENSKLNDELSKLTRLMVADNTIQEIRNTSITNAQVPVTGPGIQIVLTNPNFAGADKSKSRVTDGQNEAYVTDGQLQYIVNSLFSAGAEAISINNQRLGNQTSIRSAGSTILIGVTGVQSPYVIQAIGNESQMRSNLQHRVDEKTMFVSKGISYQVQKMEELKLPQASTVKNNFARKDKE